LTLITISNNKSVNIKRYSNSVKGSAYGNPNLAAKNPVLQIHTKIHGITLGLRVRILIIDIEATSFM
jgi:hypothetical protein